LVINKLKIFMSFRKILVITSMFFVFMPALVSAVDTTTPTATPTTPKTTASSSTSDFGLSTSADAAGLPKNSPDLMGVVANVIGTALSLIGVIFMILFIYGGFIWMTAGGDAGKTKKAKDLMTSAVIGAVLIFSAYFITKFVINELVSSTTIQSGGTTTGTGTTTGGTTTGSGSTLWD